MRCWIALHTSTTPEAQAPVWHAGAVQQAVASLALGFTPRVALLDEAVLMDVTGSLRLFGGLARLMTLLAQHITLFFESNQAVAHIQRAQGATSLIAIGRLRMAGSARGTSPHRVGDLPLHTLTAARNHLDVLERIGCRTWDELLRLPRDGVARRFGADLLAALDRARGRAPDDYTWRVLPEQFDEKLELHALVTHGPALMAGVDRLLASLQAWLLGRQSAISALKITWHLDPRRDVPPTGELEIRTAQPVQALRHVARLISEHLAQQKLPAPVHSLSLQSLATELLTDSAAATGSLLLEVRQQGDSLVELIERLSARLGDAQVQAWQAVADHRPEQMQRWVDARTALDVISATKKIAKNSIYEKANALKTLKNGERPKPVNHSVLTRRDGDGDAAEALERGLQQLKAQVKAEAKARSAVTDHRIEALYPSWLLPQPIQLATVGNSPVYQGKLTRLAGPQRMECSGWLMAGESQGDPDAHRLKPPAMRDYFIYRSEQAGLLWIYSERLSAVGTADHPQRSKGYNWYLQGFFA